MKIIVTKNGSYVYRINNKNYFLTVSEILDYYPSAMMEYTTQDGKIKHIIAIDYFM